jgi:hypothetical protein
MPKASKSVERAGASARQSRPRMRSLIAVAALGFITSWASQASAAETCNAPDANGVQACTASMDEARVREITITQHQPQWCWAASISMIFTYYGYKLTQEDIVLGVHGKVEDINAPSGEAMTKALRRHWRDPSNQEFAVSTKTGDIDANRFEISNATMASELGEGRPLLIGTRGHAMVLVSVNYQRHSDGDVVITGGQVIDPLPGKGVRRLARSEMVLSYVSSVQVASVQPGPARPLQALDEAAGRHAAAATMRADGPVYAGPGTGAAAQTHPRSP